MVRALRGSSVDQRHQNKHNIAGIVQLHPAVKKESSGTSSSASRSPQIQRKVAKCEVQQPQNVASTAPKEEQWIDGPRFHKSRVSTRMQVTRHPQREMWVDGPAQSAPVTTTATAATTSNPATPLGYGFMDQHKQGMIRQWVETQSAQRHPAGRSSAQMWIDAQPRPAPEPGTPVKVLTVFKTCPDDEDEVEQQQEPVVTVDNRSPRLSRHALKQSRSKRTTEEEIPPVATVTPMPVVVKEPEPEIIIKPQEEIAEKIESMPVKAKTTVSLTLDQLYSQCEQLAESLDQEDQSTEQGDATEVLSTDDQASDDLSAALDVTSEQVSISCDSWRRVRHHQTIEEEEDSDSLSVGHRENVNNLNLRFRVGAPMNGRGGDYSPEYIEVEEPNEPVPMQDSCLQVTEEDIAEAMNGGGDCDSQLSGEYDRSEHPLRALSQDNLTVISHFTGETYSQGTASEWEPINSVFDPVTGALHPDFFQTQLDQLAKLHQNMYEPASDDVALHPTPLSALTTNNIGSFKVFYHSSSHFQLINDLFLVLFFY